MLDSPRFRVRIGLTGTCPIALVLCLQIACTLEPLPSEEHGADGKAETASADAPPSLLVLELDDATIEATSSLGSAELPEPPPHQDYRAQLARLQRALNGSGAGVVVWDLRFRAAAGAGTDALAQAMDEAPFPVVLATLDDGVPPEPRLYDGRRAAHPYVRLVLESIQVELEFEGRPALAVMGLAGQIEHRAEGLSPASALHEALTIARCAASNKPWLTLESKDANRALRRESALTWIRGEASSPLPKGSIVLVIPTWSGFNDTLPLFGETRPGGLVHAWALDALRQHEGCSGEGRTP